MKKGFTLAEGAMHVAIFKFKSKLGFTLAEVLITLGIIGVIAALTIPTILQNSQTHSTVSALKKSYSTLSQAYAQAVKDNGPVDTWGLIAGDDPQGSENILNKLAPYLNITKNCGRNPGCFPPETYTDLRGVADAFWYSYDSAAFYAKAQLSDGTLVNFETFGDCNTKIADSSLLQNVCGEIYLDVNGFKKPNRLGVDLFQFYIGTNGITPGGSQIETGVDAWYPFYDACRDKATQDGNGCTAWVIYNENMDYLKCNNLSWNGPTKCN